MRILICLVMFCIANVGFSQCIVDKCDILGYAYKGQAQSLLDSIRLDKYNCIKDDSVFYYFSNSLNMYAQYVDDNNQSAYNNTDVLRLADASFAKAQAITEEEAEKLQQLYMKYQLLQFSDYKGMQDDLAILKSKGYKPLETGVQTYIKAGWNDGLLLGAEISFIDFFQPNFHLRDYAGSTIERQKTQIGFSLLTFGYNRNIGRKYSDLSGSLVRMTGPVLVDPTRFSLIVNEDNSFVYYKPEIGYSFNDFTLSYSYIAKLTKVGNHDIPKHEIMLRYRIF